MQKTLLAAFCTFLYATAFSQGSDTVKLKPFLADNIRVVSVEAKGGILNVAGYKIKGTDTAFVTRKVLLGLTDVLVVKNWSYVPHFALVTVPIKVRNPIDTFSQNAQTGLNNAGIGLNFVNYKLARYFSSGKSATHTFGVGVILAPSAEDLTPSNSNNYLNKTTKQLFVSAALSFSYTYNDLTFAFIPAGYDFATTTEGKHYIYNKERWWGFGIGISTKLFGLF